MSEVKKRSVLIAGHKTSISLEQSFWTALKTIADERGRLISELVGEIACGRTTNNLSSEVRVFVLTHYLKLASGPSHRGCSSLNPQGAIMSGMIGELKTTKAAD